MPSAASIVTLDYEDLIAFVPDDDDDDDSASIPAAHSRLVEQIGQAFGPAGLGILAVRGVPDFGAKRQALLPLAAQLAALPDKDLEHVVDSASLYSVGWSHGKEEIRPGQPDTAKGSFYANPLTQDLAQALRERDGADSFPKQQAERHPEFFARNVWPDRSLMPHLPTAFCDMGRLLQIVGTKVAQICDVYCRQRGVHTELESVVRNSLNAKGRLLHYFAPSTDDDRNSTNDSPWCAWHNDHGALTGLVPGMFLDAQRAPVACPDPDRCGLFIQARTGGPPVRVRVPDDHCAFQIGETSQILSGGLLQATPHAVLHSSSNNNSAAIVTRESFAVFLEPEFGAPLDVPPRKSIEDCQGAIVNQDLGLPPLSARWKPGQTFGDFHLATVSAFAVMD